MGAVAIGADCTPGPEPVGRVVHRVDWGASIEQSLWWVIHPPTFVKRADNEDTHASGASSSDSNAVATVRDGHTVHTTATDGTDRRSPSARVRSHEVIVLRIALLMRRCQKTRRLDGAHCTTGAASCR